MNKDRQIYSHHQSFEHDNLRFEGGKVCKHILNVHVCKQPVQLLSVHVCLFA